MIFRSAKTWFLDPKWRNFLVQKCNFPNSFPPTDFLIFSNPWLIAQFPCRQPSKKSKTSSTKSKSMPRWKSNECSCPSTKNFSNVSKNVVWSMESLWPVLFIAQASGKELPRQGLPCRMTMVQMSIVLRICHRIMSESTDRGCLMALLDRIKNC